MTAVEEKVSFMNNLYSPEIRQITFHQDSFEYQDRLLLGPRASGKTRVGIAEAVWHAVSFQNSRGLYFTPDIIGTVREFQELAGQWIIAQPDANHLNGLITIRPSVFFEPNFIRLISDFDTAWCRQLQAETYDYFIVDEIPWHFDWSVLLKTRMSNRSLHHYRRSLYIYSGNGIPAWLRGIGCNQHFFKTFWHEDYMGDFLPDDFVDELRSIPGYDQHSIASSVSADQSSPRLTFDVLRQGMQNIANEGRFPLMNAIQEEEELRRRMGRWKPAVEQKDEGVDEFIAEIDNLLNEPDDLKSVDEGALPKAAPTHIG